MGNDKARDRARSRARIRSWFVQTSVKKALIIRKLTQQQPIRFNRQNKPIQSAELAFFSRQMATLIEAGIPLVQSITIIARSSANYRMTLLLESIKKEVESGSDFAAALQKHPRYFNPLYCHLISAGEQSGTLDLMLNEVALYKEKIDRMKKKIKQAMHYPLAVILIALIVSAGLLIYVVPQFESLFESFGAKLPTLTQGVITLSNYLRQGYVLIMGILGAAIYGFIYATKHSLTFAYFIDNLRLKLPIMGSILKNAAIARFTRTLSITFAAGLPLFDALNAVAGVTGNRLYATATHRIRKDIANGQPLYISLENTNLFPSMVIQMIAVGEESGNLEKMLSKIADFYEEAVDNAVDGLSSLLEPLIMAILGILVGGLVIAMYLPLFKLGSVV